MDTKVINRQMRAPYIRGPHFRYFITAVAIGVLLVTALIACFVLLMWLFYS